MSTSLRFPVKRAEALARLQEFLPHIPAYAGSRNYVRPHHPDVSRLSPAIRTRALLESEVIALVLNHHGLAKSEKFIQEIAWRSYWKGWLELRPGVWSSYRAQAAAWRDSSQWPRAQRILQGHSGITVMDQLVRELVTTGYLHNHARMWFASYWIHVEELPWELGAEFFYSHLLDADPASNTLSWRWVAGLQTQGKKYLIRRTNLEKYLDPVFLSDTTGLERFNDDLVRPSVSHETANLSVRRLPTEMPDIESQCAAPWGLWIHGEELTPELSELGTLRPHTIATIESDSLKDQLGLSPLRRTYLSAALADARQRAVAHYQVEADGIQAASLSGGLCNWAQTHHLKTIIALHPWVGPLEDDLGALNKALSQIGTRLVLIRRARDLEQIPWARNGYFPFWESFKKSLPGPGVPFPVALKPPRKVDLLGE